MTPHSDIAPLPNMPPLRVLGVDPGINGGFSIVSMDGQLITAAKMPTTKRTTKTSDDKQDVDGFALYSYLDIAQPTHAFIENVHSRPRQAGQFQFGVNTGVVYGVVQSISPRVHITKVSPQSWKATYGIRGADFQTKSGVKAMARAMAARLYPQHKTLFKQVNSDGVAESLLIALYGLNLLLAPAIGAENGH